MAKMSRADFEFYRDYGIKMRSHHEEDFMRVTNPEMILKYYEGVRDIEVDAIVESDRLNPERIRLNKFFPATNTIIRELYPQNPKWIVTGRRGIASDDASAMVLASALDYYYNEIGAKRENQKTILSSWFFSFAGSKQGWNIETRDIQPEQSGSGSGFRDKAQEFMTGRKPQRGDLDWYIEKEGPFVKSIFPMDLELDHNRPFGEGKILTHKIKRTLKEVVDSPLYKKLINNDFINYFAKGADDLRTIETELREMWIQQRDGIWVFTYIDNWDRPLRWEKWGELTEGFPITLLKLNDEPKVTYPVGHFQVAQRVQREIDFIMSKWLEVISRFRNATYVNEELFGVNKAQAKNILNLNEIGSIVYGKRPATGGDIMALGSPAMPKDAFGMLEVLQTNLQEILTVTSAKQSGTSELKTLGQEQIAQMGNQLRTLGMKELIRDWLVIQGRKMAQDLKQYATPPVLFKITGLDLRDEETGQLITEKWLEFGQNGARSLKDSIQGEYDYDVDFSEAQQKDLPVIRKQMMELAGVAQQLEPQFQQAGKTFDAVAFFQDMTKNFETLSNADKYLRDIPQPAQPELMPGEEQPGAGGLPIPGAGGGLNIPTDESVRRGIERIPV